MVLRRYLPPLFFLSLLVLTLATSHAQSSHLSMQFVDGRVFLRADNVSLRAILEEWERTSGVRVVNADQLDDRTPLTLELRDVTEQVALATLLRGIPGYIVARQAGTGSIDRILILATSTAPPTAATAAIPQAPMSAFADTTFEASPADSDENGFQGAAPADVSDPEPAAAVRINSSDSITDLVEGANAATLVPPDLRPPTPLFRPPAAPGTRPGEITTGGPAPGFVDPVVTNPETHSQPASVPTAPTSR